MLKIEPFDEGADRVEPIAIDFPLTLRQLAQHVVELYEERLYNIVLLLVCWLEVEVHVNQKIHGLVPDAGDLGKDRNLP